MATAQRCHEKAHGLANPQPVVQDPLDAFAEQEESISQPEPVAQQPNYDTPQVVEEATQPPTIDVVAPSIIFLNPTMSHCQNYLKDQSQWLL